MPHMAAFCTSFLRGLLSSREYMVIFKKVINEEMNDDTEA